MTSINHHTVGDRVRLSAVFIDPDGASDDYVTPDDVTFKSRPHGGAITTTEGTEDSEGHWHADITVGSAGLWHYRVEATGTWAGTSEGRFVVDQSEFD